MERQEVVKRLHAIDQVEGRVGAVAASIIARAQGSFAIRVEAEGQPALTSEAAAAESGGRVEFEVTGLPLEPVTCQVSVVQTVEGIEAVFAADTVMTRDALSLLFPREDLLDAAIAAAETKRAGLAGELREVAVSYTNGIVDLELARLQAEIDADRRRRERELLGRRIAQTTASDLTR